VDDIERKIRLCQLGAYNMHLHLALFSINSKCPRGRRLRRAAMRSVRGVVDLYYLLSMQRCLCALNGLITLDFSENYV
jgi:hypothetical protein